MGKLATAERVSRDASDNFVFQRSLLAYDRAAEIVSGDVLEIGTGTGYGIELVAPHCDRFVTVDKYAAGGDRHAANVEFRRMCVPPLGFGDESFDFVITFQVIEHIDDDAAFVREIARVLRPGGRLILTTPNAPMSLTRNPWHVREYRIDELRRLLSEAFSAVETHGVFGNERVMEYYEHNRRSVERIARFDLFDLQHRLPRRLLQLPYDLLNRINRRRLLRQNEALTTSIRMTTTAGRRMFRPLLHRDEIARPQPDKNSTAGEGSPSPAVGIRCAIGYFCKSVVSATTMFLSTRSVTLPSTSISSVRSLISLTVP